MRSQAEYASVTLPNLSYGKQMEALFRESKLNRRCVQGHRQMFTAQVWKAYEYRSVSSESFAALLAPRLAYRGGQRCSGVARGQQDHSLELTIWNHGQ